MKSFFNRLCLSQTFRRAAVMLVVLACTSLTAQGQYKTIWFQGETTVSIFQQEYGIHAVTVKMVASAGTVLVFDNGGKPAAIGFAQEPKGIIQAEYGIDETGPKDKGRLIFKPANTNEAMPYFVIGEKDIFTYHLKYLELTTSGNDYSAYATKAIAFDNKVESLSKTNTFTMPDGGQLVVDHGKIKIDGTYISPNYDLSGKETKREFGVGNLTNSAPALPKP